MASEYDIMVHSAPSNNSNGNGNGTGNQSTGRHPLGTLVFSDGESDTEQPTTAGVVSHHSVTFLSPPESVLSGGLLSLERSSSSTTFISSLDRHGSFLSRTGRPWDLSEAGTATMTQEEADSVYLKLEAGVRPWMHAGLLFGPFAFIALILEKGPWLYPTKLPPAKYGCWLGTLTGSLIHSFFSFEVCFYLFVFVTDSVLVLLMIGLHGVAYLLILSMLLILRQQHLPLDPGPVDQIYGGVCLNGNAKVPAPPEGTLSLSEVERLATRVELLKYYYNIAAVVCAVCCPITVIYVLIFVTGASIALLGAWPYIAVASYFTVRHACFRHIDGLLDDVNQQEHMMGRNIAWVLRRSRVTLFSTLWLVRRAPDAMMVAEGNNWQGPMFQKCDPVFKRMVKLVLLCTIRNRAPAQQRTPPPLLMLPGAGEGGDGGGGGGGGGGGEFGGGFAAGAGSAGRRRSRSSGGRCGRPEEKPQHLPPELALHILSYLKTPDLLTNKSLHDARTFKSSIG